MTIAAYGSGARAAGRAAVVFADTKSTLDGLGAQLATGKKATTYAGLGSASASASLALKSRLATYESAAAVTDGKLRADLAVTGLTDMASNASKIASALIGGNKASAAERGSAVTSARVALAGAADALNTDVNGRYLFSGRSADTAPVEDVNTILDGDGTRAGLTQLVAERRAADLGASGLGRLTVAASGPNVSVAEEAAGLPFGFKLAGATTTGSGLTVTSSAGSASVSVATQPAAGSTVSLSLTLPDGSAQTLTLTARQAGAAASDGTFAIGASTADTAANLAASLGANLITTASTVLASASALATSRAFFDASAAAPPARVAGPPYDTATGVRAGTAADTVVWYKGDDAAGSARETATIPLGDGQSVALGLRANESGLRGVLATFGALASSSFPDDDATASDRFASLSSRISGVLSGENGTSAVQALATEISGVSGRLATASDRIASTKAQAEDALGSLENASPEEVAAKLLATQTRLQASYQVTATIGALRLSDYL